MELIKGNCRITLEHIGEGVDGDFDPDNEEDEPLMRFDVYKKAGPDSDYVDTGWEPIDDASYCTQINDDHVDAIKQKALNYLMQEIGPEVEAGNSIKKLCERLSWIDPLDFT